MVFVWLLPTLLALSLLLVVTFNKPLLDTRLGAEVAAGLLIAVFPFIFVSSAPVFLVSYFAILQLCAVLLAARLIFGRLDKAFVAPSTQQNCLIIIGCLAIGVTIHIVITAFPEAFGIFFLSWPLILAALIVQVVFLAQFLWARGRFRLTTTSAKRRLSDLPTVSVCIPARNEDHALSECLQQVLASDYPKLEVIVLDDCSQDKTSQIVRAFAHDGVRFIQGKTPAIGWLGKNQARQVLAEHASGEFLLFLDVDTRLAPDSITQIINYTLDSNMNMVSVLPQNRLGLQPGALFDTLRFYWQQVLIITKRRVPVASQAWLINTKAFYELGGFKSVAQKITPEASFARRLSNRNAYRFVVAHSGLGVTTAKRWPSAVASAIRLLYPTYKRQPLFALGAISGIALLFILPPVSLGFLIGLGWYGPLFWATLLTWLLTLVTYGLVRAQSHAHIWPIMVLLLPFTALQEICLLVSSLLQYEFGEVNWKGRNICYPVTAWLPQNQQDPAASPVRR